MASMRRVKVYSVLLAVIIITILFYTNQSRQTRTPDLRTPSDFYSRTKSALDGTNKKPGTPGAKDTVVGTGKSKVEDEESKAMQQRLKEAADSAKEKANAKAPKPDPPSAVVGKGNSAEQGGDKSVAGRKKYGTGEKEVTEQKPVKEEEDESEEEHNAELELNSILKKSPIIIFSKSYCPHSKHAKGILLEKYIIEPKPFVVELDQHEQGAALQNLLMEKTGRRTVPNILVNGVSIGGGDDMADLDSREKLVDKIKEYGQKKMTNVEKRPIIAEGHQNHALR